MFEHCGRNEADFFPNWHVKFMIEFGIFYSFTKIPQICINFGFQMKLTDIKDHFEMITELQDGASNSKIQNKRLNCINLHY